MAQLSLVPDPPDEDVFVPELIDHPWMPKKLSIGATLQLTRWLAAVMAKATFNLLDQARAKGGDFTITQNEVVNLLSVLEEQDLIKLLSIAIQKPEQWIVENFSVEDAIPCLIAFFQVNNLGKIWASAQIMLRTNTTQRH